MTMATFSPSSTLPLQSYNNNEPFLSLRTPLHRSKLQFVSVTTGTSSSLCFSPLRTSISDERVLRMEKKKNRRGFSAVCYAAPLTARNLQWISTISSVVLMLSKGTAVKKSFIVPLFALQAPASIISWIRGEYGMWSAFLALLVRLFFFIPGELELPLTALLLLIVAPYQVINLRGTQEGAIISLMITAYLAYQHFSGAGSLQRAFDRGSVVATLAVIICITAVSCLLLI
ncbi:cold-regulated 413 inner membrane protein 1, chloroplastic-like [Tripterygium wilfordii]|uniref:cold-regulated 413 inner membrane protein 1, chloroplastic-like n=1 Tax=Tripterygium wilfordii TaxID=458696 RepID=UPI0018F81171|nr:cold-regulated 413 inner membrane protein 1, chloroplastic-like [Tripterygium wilfordii]